MRESARNEIELKGVDGDALWALVRYCYTGNFFGILLLYMVSTVPTFLNA